MKAFGQSGNSKTTSEYHGTHLLDQSSCGLQVCQHPLCWVSHRDHSRKIKLWYSGGANTSANKSRAKLARRATISRQSIECKDGLPYLSVLDLNESGFLDDTESMCSSMPTTSKLHYESSNAFTKFQLRPFHHHSLNDFTPAPANTPLQSAHGFATDPSLEESEYSDRKPSGKKRSQPRKVDALSCKEYSMNVLSSSLKKLYLWCPAASTPENQNYRRTFSSALKRARSDVRTANINFPDNGNLGDKAHPLKGKKYKKPPLVSALHNGKTGLTPRLSHLLKLQIGRTKPLYNQMKNPTDRVARDAQTHKLRQLLSLPYDQLRDALSRAKAQGLMTEKEIISLFEEITSERNVLPSIKPAPVPLKSNPGQLDTLYITNSAVHLTSPKIRHQQSSATGPNSFTVSPRDVSKESLTAKAAPTLHPEGGLPEAETSAYMQSIADSHRPREVTSKVHKLNVVPGEIIHSYPAPMLRHCWYTGDDSRWTNAGFDSSQIPPERPQSNLKRGLTYVRAKSDVCLAYSPLPKPFHYSRNSQGISLEPLPSPSPPPTPTERDSLYDEAIGGSTVVVHPSGAPTMTSERTGSPLSTWKSKVNEATEEGAISTKGSSVKTSVWPQLSEHAILDDDVINEIDFGRTSPIARSPSGKSIRSTGTQPSESGESPKEDSSPAPPPPSPVIPPRSMSNHRAGTPNSNRLPPENPREPIEGEEAEFL